MRLLEWLFWCSFLPALLLPLIPKARRWWSIASALLPVLMAGLQVVIEGWRIQMAPLYFLALCLALIRLFIIVRGERPAPRRRGVLMTLAFAAVLVLCGVFPGWVLPVAALPELTGPYPVGIVDRELVDQARGRRLMVSVWYPAAQRGAPAPLTHHPDEVSTGLGNLTGFPALGMLFQHLRYFTLAASEGVPVVAEHEPFPVLVFSPGLSGLRLQNAPTLQELASWGYVVVAIDHTDAVAVTVFPDGEARYLNLGRLGLPSGVEPDQALMDEHVFPVWVADQRFVYDTLEQWAANDPLLAGKLDLKRMGSLGHSFGGATSLEVCRVDSRCLAAVNLDGGLYGDIVTRPAVRPLLLMSSADSSQYTETVAEWSQMVSSATGPAYWLELPRSTHYSFTFLQLLSPLIAPPGFDVRGGLSTIDMYLRAFFDTYLQGVASPLLETTPGESDVRWRMIQQTP